MASSRKSYNNNAGRIPSRLEPITTEVEDNSFEDTEDSGEESHFEESYSNEESSEELADNEDSTVFNWIPYQHPDFPKQQLGNSDPKFTGPVLNSNSQNITSRLFTIARVPMLTPLQWFFEYLSLEFWSAVIVFTNSNAQHDQKWSLLNENEL